MRAILTSRSFQRFVNFCHQLTFYSDQHSFSSSILKYPFKRYIPKLTSVNHWWRVNDRINKLWLKCRFNFRWYRHATFPGPRSTPDTSQSQGRLHYMPVWTKWKGDDDNTNKYEVVRRTSGPGPVMCTRLFWIQNEDKYFFRSVRSGLRRPKTCVICSAKFVLKSNPLVMHALMVN